MSPCCSRVVLHGCLANTSPQCLQRQRKVETHDWPFLSSLLRSRISFWRVYKQGIALRLPLTTLHSWRVRRHAKLPFGGARGCFTSVFQYNFCLFRVFEGRWMIWGMVRLPAHWEDKTGPREGGGWWRREGRGGRQDGDSPLTRW